MVVAPLIFNTEETLQIFEILNVQLTSINEKILISFLVLSFVSNILILDDKELR